MGNASKKLSKKKSTSTEQMNLQPDFRHVNGRRYHNDVNSRYYLPNDHDELDRLHLQHFVFKHMFKSNFFAPVGHVLGKDGSKILDVGCGAGSWMFDMATEYPKTKIIGVDISPIQPTEIKPTNVSVVYANVLNGLPFESDTFDFVFQRLMVAAIPSNRWSDVIVELTRVLKPGCYLELSEMSLFGGHRLGPVSTKIFDSLCEAQKSRNLDNNLTHKLRLLLEQNEELEDVHEEKNRMRFKTEDGKLGKAAIDNCQNVMRNMKPVLLPILAVTSEKFDEMISVLGKELEDNDSYLDISRVYGRKKGNI